MRKLESFYQSINNVFSKIDRKYIFCAFVILFFVGLLPILYLGFYNFSGADDFSIGWPTHVAWKDTHSFIEVLKAACWMVKDTYYAWMGSYSAIFLNSLPPSLFGEQFYSFVPFIILPIFCSSIFCLGKLLFCKVLKMDTYSSYIVIIIGLLLAIQFLPSVVEGLYWWQGAVYYTLFFSVSLFAVNYGIKFIYDSNRSVFHMIMVTILSFICAGSNYITALVTPLALGLILIIGILYKRRKSWYLLIPIAFAILGLLISAAAPGNAIRAEGIPEYPLFGSMLKAFQYAFIQTNLWTNMFLLLCLMFLFPFMCKMVQTTEYEFKYPVIISILSLCYLACSCFPSLFAAGWLGSGRLVNVIYYNFIGLLFLNVLYWIGWLEHDFRKYNEFSLTTFLLRKIKSNAGMLAILFSIIFGFHIFANDVYKQATSIRAATSILSGESWQYKYEMQERYQLLNDDSNEVILKPLTVKPELIFFDDITTNNDDWRNIAMRRWFQKDVIIIDSTQ